LRRPGSHGRHDRYRAQASTADRPAAVFSARSPLVVRAGERAAMAKPGSGGGDELHRRPGRAQFRACLRTGSA
jgi:hypothetical protein